jgi:hypothetical protein
MLISFMYFRLLIIPVMAIHTYIIVLGLHSFGLKDSLRMAARCRNMLEINKLFVINCILLSAVFGCYINHCLELILRNIY